MARTPGQQPPRLRDVAELAGVHPSTVSRVLAGSTDVRARPETLERIRTSARQLGYRPNALARALRMANVGALGLLVPTLRNPVFSAVTRGAYQRAWERNFVVVLAQDGGGDDAVYERLVQEGRIDGLLVASGRPGSPLAERLRQSTTPHVFLSRGEPGSRRNVVMREEDAGRLAAHHLLELGHRHIGTLAGPAGLDNAQRRTAGLARATRDAGGQLTVVHGELDEQAGFDGMRELLGAPQRPSAIFVTNLNQSIGALAAARAAGFRIPEDISIVVCDEDPVNDFLSPRLTAVRMPVEEAGAVAADALIGQVQGDAPADVVVPTAPELVLRTSTAPPA